MAIQNTGLAFFPLYWAWHDQWKYYTPAPNYQEFLHFGHLHFWMMGFSATQQPSGDAFSGRQTYSFNLQEVWGPNSTDANQSQVYTIIGKPKWFFNVVEMWRRVYIQDWDAKVSSKNILDQRGVKYDASPINDPNYGTKQAGPFREGFYFDQQNIFRNYYCPYWMQSARSLPVEYFHDTAMTQQNRDNYVMARAQSLLTAAGEPFDPNRFNLLHADMVPKGSPPGVPPFWDDLYIFPIIEYQQVQQLNWEVLPGKPADVPIEEADENYGDGYDSSVTIPFVDPTTGFYRSPFATQPGQVLEFGQYNELALPGGRKLVPTDKRLNYATVTYNNDPTSNGYSPNTSITQFPPTHSGQPITSWHNPWKGTDAGRVVQQCLGGIVQAQAKIVVQHRLGGRYAFWTTPIQYTTPQAFEGSDQDMPA